MSDARSKSGGRITYWHSSGTLDQTPCEEIPSASVTSSLNNALLRLAKRADQVDPLKLVETFVDVGPLLAMLSSSDHQIIYGRRGTGKTHALSYLADDVGRRGDLAVYVDMRTIGSTGGIYGDPNLPITERGTRLLVDTVSLLHDALVDFALRKGIRVCVSWSGTRSTGSTCERNRHKCPRRRHGGHGGIEYGEVDDPVRTEGIGRFVDESIDCGGGVD